jgi:hypothetical protein
MTRTMMQKKQMVIHEFGIHVVTMQDPAVGFTFYRWLVVVRVPGSLQKYLLDIHMRFNITYLLRHTHRYIDAQAHQSCLLF